MIYILYSGIINPKKSNMEVEGIDPPTLCMLSTRSTI